jgi:Tol biopolymer transport system component/DNA-binding winged helix-turn-helix (wHTH) protein
MDRLAKRLYAFGPFLLDPAERLLLRDDRVVPLAPKAFATLLALVENSGHVINKDELIKQVWPDTFVEEVGLARNISVLRRVLGEGQDEPQYIETIPKLGYRFTASVKQVRDEGVDLIVERHIKARVTIEKEETSSQDLIEQEPRRLPLGAGDSRKGRRNWRWRGVFLVIGGLLLGFGLYYWKASKANAHPTYPMRLTNNPANDQYASWSPDGTKIAFTSNRDGKDEIYVMDAAGSNVRRLTHNATTDDHPAWSPDGTKIAFHSDRDGNLEIYVMAADGSHQTRLTNDSAADAGPAWSPDGTRIAFASNRGNSSLYNFDIWVMNSDGSNQTRLTTDLEYDADPTWSPDGKQIAFVSGRDHNFEVYVMNADGTNQTNLTHQAKNDESPDWSPDGARIAFSSSRDGNREIYVMNSDGGSQRKLTNNPSVDVEPAWSPDGKKIAFWSNRDGSGQLYVMNADGGLQTRLSDRPVNASATTWSPDGAKLAFQSDHPDPGNPSGSHQIYVMNADGTGVRRLTGDQTRRSIEPAWSPDGRRIAFGLVGILEADSKISVMAADGSQAVRLTTGVSLDRKLAWSPDGSRIAFQSNRDGNYEIYVLNVLWPAQ